MNINSNQLDYRTRPFEPKAQGKAIPTSGAACLYNDTSVTFVTFLIFHLVLNNFNNRRCDAESIMMVLISV